MLRPWQPTTTNNRTLPRPGSLNNVAHRLPRVSEYIRPGSGLNKNNQQELCNDLGAQAPYGVYCLVHGHVCAYCAHEMPMLHRFSCQPFCPYRSYRSLIHDDGLAQFLPSLVDNEQLNYCDGSAYDPSLGVSDGEEKIKKACQITKSSEEPFSDTRLSSCKQSRSVQSDQSTQYPPEPGTDSSSRVLPSYETLKQEEDALIERCRELGNVDPRVLVSGKTLETAPELDMEDNVNAEDLEVPSDDILKARSFSGTPVPGLKQENAADGEFWKLYWGESSSEDGYAYHQDYEWFSRSPTPIIPSSSKDTIPSIKNEAYFSSWFDSELKQEDDEKAGEFRPDEKNDEQERSAGLVLAGRSPAEIRPQDITLVQAKRAGLSYKEIRRRYSFTEAESTLRGRFRCLTKAKEERLRRPVWKAADIDLLLQAVRNLQAKRARTRPKRRDFAVEDDPKCGSGPTAEPTGTSTKSRGKGKSGRAGRSPDVESTDSHTPKVPWSRVAEYIADNGGSYRFGNATCRRKWDELHHIRRRPRQRPRGAVRS